MGGITPAHYVYAAASALCAPKRASLDGTRIRPGIKKVSRDDRALGLVPKSSSVGGLDDSRLFDGRIAMFV